MKVEIELTDEQVERFKRVVGREQVRPGWVKPLLAYEDARSLGFLMQDAVVSERDPGWKGRVLDALAEEGVPPGRVWRGREAGGGINLALSEVEARALELQLKMVTGRFGEVVQVRPEHYDTLRGIRERILGLLR